MIEPPEAGEFPGTGPGGKGINDELRTRHEFLYNVKACLRCHQVEGKFTRGHPNAADYDSSADAWDARVRMRQRGAEMSMWMSRFGRQRGLMQAPGMHLGPDDHLGLELAFVATLSDLAARGDTAQRARCFEAQRDFLRDHLLAWAPAYLALVEKHAETDYYRGAARLALARGCGPFTSAALSAFGGLHTAGVGVSRRAQFGNRIAARSGRLSVARPQRPEKR